MKLETKNFKNACSKILSAIDNSSNIINITDVLELKTINNILYLSVTNKEYYVSVKFNLNQEENFHATVNAEIFLKLISQITTEEIILKLEATYISIKGNGNYKIPLIFENDSLMELPKIEILNPTLNTTIDKTKLDSICNYNSREIIKENITKPIQKMYYLDNQGCITFTGTGACVNNFNLDASLKVLLSSRIVKLFKLFKSDNINFLLGYDAISEDIIQTKISFKDEEVELYAILNCDDSLLNSIPVNAIRSKSNSSYNYNIVLDKNLLSQALSRLLIFNKNSIYNYYKFSFGPLEVAISDENCINIETLNYQNEPLNLKEYEAYLNINELKSILDGSSDSFINLSFGNKEAIIVTRGSIKNILMEYQKD